MSGQIKGRQIRYIRYIKMADILTDPPTSVPVHIVVDTIVHSHEPKIVDELAYCLILTILQGVVALLPCHY